MIQTNSLIYLTLNILNYLQFLVSGRMQNFLFLNYLQKDVDKTTLDKIIFTLNSEFRLVPQFYKQFKRIHGNAAYARMLKHNTYFPTKKFSKRIYNLFGFERPRHCFLIEESRWLEENWKDLQSNYRKLCITHHPDHNPCGTDYFWVIVYAWKLLKKRRSWLQAQFH